MIRALLILLLLATPAHAVKSIAVVGDSIQWGGLTSIEPFDSTGYRHSRWSMADTLRSLLTAAPVANTWKNATVNDWSINSSNPSDWSTAPGASLCSSWRTKFPHLEAACRDSAPIKNYIGSGYDAVLLMFNGDVNPANAATWVTTLETLKTSLDLVNGSILLGSPPWGPASGTSALPADAYRSGRIATEAEMTSRGIITGAHDTTGLLPMCVDTIHARDHGYASQAALWYAALP